MKERGAIFRQSQHDFPCFVELGKNKPSFGINRWGNCAAKAACALRFVPVDDEGFAVRGDKRRLLYKGRRRSHRFTILNDGAFEYDCILLREPESNVITLRMEGAELYDFFRQPDFVHDDFLKGSYAVYKKETLVGQGTGKLCHIHRPLIIDALGRKVWGELSVVGNELNITIPEWWLSNAKFPVTVDPTVGTTTVGSQWQYYNTDYDPKYPDDEPMYIQDKSECTIDVSKFTVPEFINGQCTAYFYVMKDRTYDEKDCGGRPVFYSDQNNKPVVRKSKQENFIDFYAKTLNNEGWRSGTFSSNENIPAGSNIWFGCFCEYFWFYRFDYSSLLYGAEWFHNGGNTIPETFPTYYPYQINYKLSMYFTYTSAQNYVRTLTQGVNLTDNRLLNAEYKRTLPQTSQVNDTRNLKADYKREFNETQNITDIFQQIRDYIRCLKIETAIIAETERSGDFYRTHGDTVNVDGFSFRHLLIYIKLFSASFVRDFILKRFLVSKEQIELKSLITKNLNIESKL